MDGVLTDEKLVFDYEKWEARLPELKAAYQRAQPYPHIALDDFLEPWAIENMWNEFPRVQDDGWIHYMHVNEKKHGLNKVELLPPFIRRVVAELNSPSFLHFVEQLTGIPHLLADEMLEGGGLHQSMRGGFLNVHADFTVHPHKRKWQRRVNLLIYVNKHWQESYGGDLELWSRDMKRCEQRIPPLFNRCVLFNTDEDSYHGLPDPIQCPEDDSRKSLALYYFTEEQHTPRLRTTNYRARPTDGLKSVLIYLDKSLISVYTRVKRSLGLSDDFASKVLNLFSRKK